MYFFLSLIFFKDDLYRLKTKYYNHHRIYSSLVSIRHLRMLREVAGSIPGSGKYYDLRFSIVIIDELYLKNLSFSYIELIQLSSSNYILIGGKL